MTRTERREYLERQHAMYCDYNQEPREDCEFMAANGHPYASLYRRYRRFFDKLKYACNSDARFVSFVHEHEYCEYWAPELSVSWHLEEFGGEWFGHIYPAHDRWDEYLEHCAEHGWPAECKPGLSSGSFSITTQNEEFFRALAIFLGDGIFSVSKSNHYTKHVHDLTFKQFYAVVRLIREYHKGYVISPRTPEDDRRDTAALPLPEKRFALGGVEEVTVTDRSVLVPLIPFGAAGEAILSKAVNRIVDLLNDGFPWTQAEGWLKGFLKAGAWRKLEKQFAH